MSEEEEKQSSDRKFKKRHNDLMHDINPKKSRGDSSSPEDSTLRVEKVDSKALLKKKRQTSQPKETEQFMTYEPSESNATNYNVPMPDFKNVIGGKGVPSKQLEIERAIDKDRSQIFSETENSLDDNIDIKYGETIPIK